MIERGWDSMEAQLGVGFKGCNMADAKVGYCTLSRSRCGSLNHVVDGRLVAVFPNLGLYTAGAYGIPIDALLFLPKTRGRDITPEVLGAQRNELLSLSSMAHSA